MDCPTRTPAKSGHAGASHPSCSGRSGQVQRFETLLNLLYAISNSHPQVPQPLFTSKTMCLVVWLCEISLCSDIVVEQEQPRALIHGWYLKSSGVFFVTLGWLGVSTELGTCLSCRVRGTFCGCYHNSKSSLCQSWKQLPRHACLALVAVHRIHSSPGLWVLSWCQYRGRSGVLTCCVTLVCHAAT